MKNIDDHGRRKKYGRKVERECNSQSPGKKASENERWGNGLNMAMIKPKRKKWKVQARGEDKSEEKKAKKAIWAQDS